MNFLGDTIPNQKAICKFYKKLRKEVLEKHLWYVEPYENIWVLSESLYFQSNQSRTIKKSYFFITLCFFVCKFSFNDMFFSSFLDCLLFFVFNRSDFDNISFHLSIRSLMMLLTTPETPRPLHPFFSFFFENAHQDIFVVIHPLINFQLFFRPLFLHFLLLQARE